MHAGDHPKPTWLADYPLHLQILILHFTLVREQWTEWLSWGYSVTPQSIPQSFSCPISDSPFHMMDGLLGQIAWGCLEDYVWLAPCVINIATPPPPPLQGWEYPCLAVEDKDLSSPLAPALGEGEPRPGSVFIQDSGYYSGGRSSTGILRNLQSWQGIHLISVWCIRMSHLRNSADNRPKFLYSNGALMCPDIAWVQKFYIYTQAAPPDKGY